MRFRSSQHAGDGGMWIIFSCLHEGGILSLLLRGGLSWSRASTLLLSTQRFSKLQELTQASGYSEAVS